MRFAEAARDTPVATVFGAELSVGATAPRAGSPDPDGEHLLARGAAGYGRLAAALGDAHLAGGAKGRPHYYLDDLAPRAMVRW
ncbi:hypothetical protein [Actinomadura rudentiformis]|uniref:Uncharacterized protein n=1 Tax=Actinomadura rudentiformis TaxID=359158 RepID=A0A6H9YZL0_9ACTN|nr:hypothetical protein [Actinomadura rudentiformis]KAB2346889.1 hypothetical protein F8566_22055 [Actinomadura rudentiformis]